MRNIAFALMVLLLSATAIAQCTSGQVISPALPVGSGQPVSFAPFRVCTSTATGTPCSPLYSPIYYDPALSKVQSNPSSTDGNGNWTVCAGPGSYMVQFSPIAGTTYTNYFSVISFLSPTITTPTITSPTITGTDNGIETLVNKTLTSPTTTGTDTGTETMTNKTLTAPAISSPTTTGTDSGTETLTNKTFTAPAISSPTTTGTDSGTETLQHKTMDNTNTLPAATSSYLGATYLPTSVLKKGSNSGTAYTTASTSPVNVDGTNLVYTVTVPTGWKLLIWASATMYQSTAVSALLLSLYDTYSSTTLLTNAIVPATTGVYTPVPLNWILTGDGNSHTIELQFATNNGSDAANIQNASGQIPTMTFILMPSN